MITYENIYDVETPYLSGFLSKRKGNKSTVDFSFELNSKYNNITFIGIKDNNVNFVTDILSTIQPLDDIEESYNEMKARYNKKVTTKYPEELLLTSLISLKGTTIDNLNELIAIMKEKNYDSFIIDTLEKEIEYLERK